MEAVRTSETSVYFNETTRRYIPEGYNPHTRRRENLKSHIMVLLDCDAVLTCRWVPTFLWTILPRFSELKMAVGSMSSFRLIYYIYICYCIYHCILFVCLVWLWYSLNLAPEPEGSPPYLQQPATDPYPEPIESTLHPPKLISLRLILIPSSHLRLGLPSGVFPSGFPHHNPLHFTVLSHACHMSRPPHSPWFDLTNDIWVWVQNMKLLVVQLPTFSCYFITLWSKHSSFSPKKKNRKKIQNSNPVTLCIKSLCYSATVGTGVAQSV
jgi:hypothetical protein